MSPRTITTWFTVSTLNLRVLNHNHLRARCLMETPWISRDKTHKYHKPCTTASKTSKGMWNTPALTSSEPKLISTMPKINLRLTSLPSQMQSKATMEGKASSPMPACKYSEIIEAVMLVLHLLWREHQPLKESLEEPYMKNNTKRISTDRETTLPHPKVKKLYRMLHIKITWSRVSRNLRQKTQ